MSTVGVKTRFGTTKHIKDVLFTGQHSFFATPTINNSIIQSKIIEAWPHIMGNLINTRTSKLYVYDNTLFISVTSSILKTEISLSKTKIIDKINKFLGYSFIKEIRLANIKYN